MTAKTTDELLIQVSLDVKKIQEGFSKLDRRMTDFSKKSSDSINKSVANVEKFANRMNTVMTHALDLLALKFSVTFGKNIIETFANTGANLHILSKQIGESVGTLDQWGTAVRKAGGNADTFASTVTNLHDKLVDMKFKGDPNTAGIFQMLGMSTQDANGNVKKPTEILLELADKLQGKSQDFKQMIGRSLGIDDATMRILSKGRAETEKFVSAQDRLWDDKSAAKAQKMQERLIDLDRKLEKLKLTIADKLLPFAYKLIDWISLFVDKHGKDLALALETFVSLFIDMMKYMPSIIEKIAKFGQETGIGAKEVGKLVAAIIGLKVAKDIFGGMASTIRLLINPLTAVLGLVTSIYEVYQMIKSKNDNPDEFNKNMQKSFDDSFLKRGLDKLSSFTGINFVGKTTSRNLWDNLLDAIAPAQMQKESGGKAGAIGDGGKSFGLFQVQKGAAKDVLGYEPTDAQMKDPVFNRELRDKYMQKGMKLSGGDIAGALAFYNGGYGGLEHYKKTGKSYNNYAEDILAMSNKPMMTPANLPNASTMSQGVQGQLASKPSSSNTSNTTNIHVANMDVQADNPKEFATQMKLNPTFPFIGTRIA